MKVYDSQHIRNVVLLGAPKSGKTTLVESLLYEAGIINRRGTVEEGNTVSDYHEIERERTHSVYTTLVHAEWRNTKINLLDTPGLDDFVGEVVTALRVADSCLLLLNAQHGVEVGTELIWNHYLAANKPLLFVINQLDHEKSLFEQTVEEGKKRFGKAFTLIQYPLSEGPGFQAIVDVLNMVVYRYPPQGGKPSKEPIPDSEKQRAEELHNQLVEKAAENDDRLMESYFEKGTLNEEELQQGLKAGILKKSVYPVFCTSAKANMGAGRLLGFIQNFCPSPVESPAEVGADGKELAMDSHGPAVFFLFKNLVEPHLGSLSIGKVLSGEISAGMDLVNTDNNSTERLNQLFVINGKNRTPIQKLLAGDLGATLKLKNAQTNQTLVTKGFAFAAQPIAFPPPRISVAVAVKNKGDEEKLSTVLAEIHKEDCTLLVEYSRELRQVLLHAQGELHLNAIRWKLENVYKMHVEYERMKIPYRETIRKSGQATYRHKKQSGGAGQFAEVTMLIEPYREGYQIPPHLTLRGKEEIDLEWGGKLIYHNCIVGGAIDARFMPSILKGIMEKMQEGPVTGSYVRDICVYVHDGKMHPVDSNDTAFKIAGAMVFKECFRLADPKLLEPVYDLEVLVPEEQLGDVMGDLNTRRATILGMDARNGYSVIRARVPLAELDKYSNTLRSLTQGKASFTMRFAEYQVVPPEIQKKLAEEYQNQNKQEAA